MRRAVCTATSRQCVGKLDDRNNFATHCREVAKLNKEETDSLMGRKIHRAIFMRKNRTFPKRNEKRKNVSFIPSKK